MVTDWKWQLILIAPDAANTQANRDIFAQVFVDDGSGESLADEKKMFVNAPRLALSSAPTAQVARGIETAVKQSMRDNLEAAIATINTPLSAVNKLRWYAVANIDLTNFSEGDLIATNYGNTGFTVGEPFSFQDALTDFGLVVIEEAI